MKYVFKGKEYESLSKCYNDNKSICAFTYETLKNRLKEGMTLEKAFASGKRKRGLSSRLGSHIVEGVKYINLPSIAKEYGMSLNLIYKRYSRGLRGDDIVPEKKRKNYLETEKPQKKEIYKFFVDGVGYKTYQEACRKYGVIYTTFQKRRAIGRTIAQALGVDKFVDKRIMSTHNKGRKRKKVEVKLIVKGKIYTSYVQLAKAYNLSPQKVRKRIKVWGYTPEQAVTMEGRLKKVNIDGKDYKSIAHVARAYDLPPENVLFRMRKGMTLEQAVKFKPYEHRIIKYKGKTYKNYADLAKLYKIPHKMFYYRIGLGGYSISDAIALGNKKITSKGRYNKKILERNPELGLKPAVLYFVSFIFDDKKRYKIGITTKKIRSRFQAKTITSFIDNYKELKVMKSTLIKCYILEQQLLKLLSSYRDRKITSVIDGYTEIFDLPQDIVDQVLVIIGENQ